MSALVIGRMYEVPCVFVERSLRGGWMPRDGWVPTLGPKHDDDEHLAFPWQHYHVDWRFVSEAAHRYAQGSNRLGSAHNKVLTSSSGHHEHLCAPVLKRRLMRREMPDFPSLAAYASTRSIPMAWHRMERAHACQKLKPGNICPHRGIDLTPFIKPDGTVICPGHGLRWDTKTGALLPHHAR